MAPPSRYDELIRRTTAGDGTANERGPSGAPSPRTVGRVRTLRISTAARTLVAVAAVLLLFLAACGKDSEKKASSGSPSTTSPSTTSPAPTTTEEGKQGAAGSASTPVSVAPTNPVAHLVAVRAARQDTVDRVVFEFTEQVPGYSVSYKPKPITGTSGKEVATAGSAALVVRMEQASGVELGTTLKQTYTGPTRIQPPGTRLVKELAQVEDFEGVLSWVIGLDAQAPFRVSTLTSPPRLVIDIAS